MPLHPVKTVYSSLVVGMDWQSAEAPLVSAMVA